MFPNPSIQAYRPPSRNRRFSLNNRISLSAGLTICMLMSGFVFHEPRFGNTHIPREGIHSAKGEVPFADKILVNAAAAPLGPNNGKKNGMIRASTFLGGNDVVYEHIESAVAVDEHGNIFLAGYTTTANFPVTAGAFSRDRSGCDKEFFVAKLNSTLQKLLACTFLGGNNDDGWESYIDISIDTNGNVFVAGGTNSPDFPTTPDSYDETYNGGKRDFFVSKFSNDLSSLTASTYLGGSGTEAPQNRTMLSIDKEGNIYVANVTSSSDFPTTESAYDESYNGGECDIFVSKFDNDLGNLLASTFIGGVSYDGAWNVAQDDEGNLYLTGCTGSQDFPILSGSYQDSFNGSLDVFVAVLSCDLTQLQASTYLGGENADFSYSIALDREGNIFVGGHAGVGFPSTSGAYRKIHNGRDEAFVSKLNGNLTNLLASTFLGRGLSNDMVSDGEGNIYVAGYTVQPDFPTTPGAYDETYNGGGADIVVAKLDNSLSRLVSSTFLGSNGYEKNASILLDKKNNLYLTGYTTSADFPISSEGYDEIFDNKQDMYVLKMSKNFSKGPLEDVHNAVKKGSINLVKKKLSRNPEFTGKKDRYKRTMLHWAARYGQKDITELLILKNADGNSKDESGNTPLHLAAMFNQEHIVKLLISQSIDLNAKNDRGETPLHAAAGSLDNAEIIEILLAKGSFINATDNTNKTPLHLASERWWTLPNALALLAPEADLNLQDDRGKTPLHYAVWQGAPAKDLIEKMISNGADTSIKDIDGKTPLDLAGEKGDEEIIKLLQGKKKR